MKFMTRWQPMEYLRLASRLSRQELEEHKKQILASAEFFLWEAPRRFCSKRLKVREMARAMKILESLGYAPPKVPDEAASPEEVLAALKKAQEWWVETFGTHEIHAICVSEEEVDKVMIRAREDGSISLGRLFFWEALNLSEFDYDACIWDYPLDCEDLSEEEEKKEIEEEQQLSRLIFEYCLRFDEEYELWQKAGEYNPETGNVRLYVTGAEKLAEGSAEEVAPAVRIVLNALALKDALDVLCT